MPYAVHVTTYYNDPRNAYSGCLRDSNYEHAPIIKYTTRADAEAVAKSLNDELSGDYYLSYDEYGRPDYKVIGVR